MGDLLIDAPGGDTLPLRVVAGVGQAEAPNAVNREECRRILVTCYAEGDDVDGVMRDLRAQI